jgi:large repetitive protein
LRRLVALLTLGVAALLLTAEATGVPDTPGDPTPPVVTPVITGTLGDAGWYTTNVTVNWSISDPESIILSTSGCDARTLNADTVATRLACTATSDGGETTVAKTFKVDKTAPAASAAASRAADSNGWYNHSLTVDFSGTDGTSGLQSCTAPQTYSGPDSATATVSGTCRDAAGNTTPASLPVKYDQTAPQATASPGRAPDGNGWYNHALAVGFTGTDGTSGVASCTQLNYAGPDDPSVALTGTCRDAAGNVSTTSTFTLKYDETAPQATATPSRPTDVNGWYNRAVVVSFTGTDTTSGLDVCDPAKTYSGPDSASVSVSGSCRDLAGNVAPRSFGLKYDATGPQVTATPARAANANGWYNAAIGVTFAATDGISGVGSCDGPKTYSGPDSSTASVAGTCLDQAGNARSATLPVKYDATTPATTATPGRSADSNGWFNRALTVTFGGTDGMSGLDTCDAAKTYSGPDVAAATLSGACRDKAGNSASSAYTLAYDATAPSVTAAADRAPNAAGWYRAPVTVGFTGGDATSGLASCGAAKTYSGPDSSTASVAGTCTDRAGNVGNGSIGLKYDATAPAVTATPGRSANANGWYNAPLGVTFAGADATSGTASCDAAKTYSGPDTAGTAVSGACSDQAGNTASGSLALKYDATLPQVTGATPARAANAKGWYAAPVDISFGGTDATSGIQGCSAVTYSGPDTAAGSVNGSCADKAGNQSASGSFALKYDATAPAVTAASSRAADANGWFNHLLSVSFSGTDGTSGIASCDAAKSYAGPDTASTSLGGSCRDEAGNAASASLTLKYDGTAPAASATASRAPNAAGWYSASVTISFAATDATSGLASCDAAKTYSGPDATGASVSGTCTDKAGNPASPSLLVRYDATAPAATATASRGPDANGWFNKPLTVNTTGSDLTSGIVSCSAPQAYAGPDTAAVSLTGSCTDRAGNGSAAAVYGLKYDATAPTVTGGAPARAPDRSGWYNRPVAFSVQGTDGVSGLAGCPAITYGGPDSATASVLGACLDQAGNQGTRAFPLSYDGTGPAVTATPTRAPDAGAWYNHALGVSFLGTDAVSGLGSCDGSQSYDGPDTKLAIVGGTCVDNAGNVGLGSLPVQYDATAPQVTGAAADRAPDGAGWYNRAVVVTFQGRDETSEIDACTRAAYAGPDSSTASVSGSCRDRAGNQSGASPFPLRYDGTPPALSDVRVKAGNRRAELSWKATQDTAEVEIRRNTSVVYRGTGTSFTDTHLENGVRYRYTLAAFDEARNQAVTAVAARPTSPLTVPAAGATVIRPPRLVWTAVPKATHYNVQLWRKGRILSVWPRRTSLQLHQVWTYAGRRYRLEPGRYRWYVWPGYGRPRAGRYGPLLGSSSFVVRAAKG